MDDFERGRLKRELRTARLKRQGVENIGCYCGENDPLCIEVEHPFRRAHDPTVWGICANCHRKKSAWEQRVHPPAQLHIGNPHAQRAHQFLNSSYYLRTMADMLEKAGWSEFELAKRDVTLED